MLDVLTSNRKTVSKISRLYTLKVRIEISDKLCKLYRIKIDNTSSITNEEALKICTADDSEMSKRRKAEEQMEASHVFAFYSLCVDTAYGHATRASYVLQRPVGKEKSMK